MTAYKSERELGDTIVALRKQRKLSQGELAAAVDTTQATISRIENGERAMGAGLLLRLASFFDVEPASILRLSKQPVAAFRAGRVDDASIAQATAIVEAVAEDYLDLRALVGLTDEPQPASVGGRDPIKAAHRQREVLGIGVRGPLPDVLEVVEASGPKVVITSLPGDGLDGMFTFVQGIPLIVINSALATVRQRFTLAHELGHFVYGLPAYDSFAWASEDLPEVFANRFAAEFLAPRPAVLQWFKANDVQQVDAEVLLRLGHFFDVSAWVALYRCVAIGRVSDAQKAALEKMLTAGEHIAVARQLRLPLRSDSLVTAQDWDIRVPEELLRLVLTAYEYELLDEVEAAKRLRIGVDDFDEFVEEWRSELPAEDALEQSLAVSVA